jgi:hypothetical protein
MLGALILADDPLEGSFDSADVDGSSVACIKRQGHRYVKPPPQPNPPPSLKSASVISSRTNCACRVHPVFT